MKTNKITTLSALSCLLLFSMTLCYTSCKKKTTEVPPNPNEEELITTMKIVFIDSAGVQPTVTSTYRDVDGDGGNTPSMWDTIKLKANTTYNAEILLLDETKTPADTISNEVEEEGADHLFCFSVNGLNNTISTTDTDVNGLPIGLLTKWKTGSTSVGNVQIILRHQPGIKTGSCTPGESDIDLIFQSKVE